MDFWIKNEYQRGRLTKIMGETIPDDGEGNPALTPQQIIRWYRAVASREGEGDIWAEGTPRAAELLGLEDEVWKTHKHGYGPHWDGRYLQFVHSPVWIVAAMGWATKGRDPFNHQHGYLERYPNFVSEWRAPRTSHWGTPTIPYSEICELGAQIYGAEHANSGWDNPSLAYTDKEYVTLWHEYRGVIKDSVPVCDRQFPLLYDTLGTPAKVGVIDAETQAFNAVVGTNWDLKEMHAHCEKVRNIVRAIHVRQGRTRDIDESVIPYFTQPDAWPDEPAPSSIEPDKFRALLDRYYVLHGWDKNTGWPTRAHLEEIGLKDVADELASHGKLP
jgi:aldehyde:ferredoxin oxidoreductase